jgi:hypothetical protein
MTLNYSILFTIELLHEYFSNQKCTGLEIVPADDCRKVSKSLDMQWRYIDNRLIALIRENERNGPFVNSYENKFYRKFYGQTVFRFYIKLTNPLFFNYTNIESLTGTKKKFYFSNLANNKENGICYLTKPVKEFTAGATYLPGDLVKDSANGNVFESIKKHVAPKKAKFSDAALWIPKGLLHLPKKIENYTAGKSYMQGDLVKKSDTRDIYQALKKNTGGKSEELNDTALWAFRGEGQLQYPSENDISEFSAGTYIFSLSAKLTKATVSVFKFNCNAAKPAYDVPAIPVTELRFNEPVEKVNIDLSKLDAGMYEIKVNDQSKLVYYDPQLRAGNIIGVIEIYNHLTGKDDYALLTDDEKINGTKYHIHFANRSVLWKYIRKDGKARSITDTAEKYTFKLNGDEFVSEIPIPLSETVIKTLKLEFKTNDFPQFPLPNPGINHLGKCTQDDYDYLCSAIQLNY